MGAVAANPDTTLGIYVDDAGQSASGGAAHVIEVLTTSALALVAGVAKLKLRISSKSVVVASSQKLAEAVGKQCATNARDLGLSYNPPRDDSRLCSTSAL